MRASGLPLSLPAPAFQDWVEYMDKNYTDSKAWAAVKEALRENPKAFNAQASGLIAGYTPRQVAFIVRCEDINGCANIEPKFGEFLEKIRMSDGKQVDTKE